MLFYDEIAKQIEQSDINPEIFTSINTLDSKYHIYIYMIIYTYHIKEGNKSESIPYDGKTMYLGKGIKFIIENLPKKLQCMIYKFLEIIKQ